MSKNKSAPVMLLAACLLLTACSGISPENPAAYEKAAVPKQTEYKTTAAAMDVYSAEAKGSASVYYPIWAELTWDAGNARLKKLKVRKNQRVKKGDILAEFEISASAAQQTQLQLQLQRKNEEFAKGKTARLNAVNEAKASLAGLSSYRKQIAKLELEKLETAYELYVYQTEREIASLQESLEAFLKTLTDNTLVAPFDGIVESVASLREGDKVEAGQILVSMYSEEEFYLRVKDPNGKLRYGMEVSVETGRANQRKTYMGTVIAAPNVLPSAKSQSDAYIRITESVIPGDFQGSTLFYSTPEYLEKVLTVDSKTLNWEDGSVFLNILEDGAVKKRYVTLGLSNKDFAWIINGLSEGQQVITD